MNWTLLLVGILPIIGRALAQSTNPYLQELGVLLGAIGTPAAANKAAATRHQVALVSEAASVNFAQLIKMEEALQIQVDRDFAPHWGVSASVRAYASRAAVPAGVWPIIIQDTLDQPGAAGYHTDANGQPYALVDAADGEVSVTVSHELLEMLADPWGNRLISAPDVRPGATGNVHYLCEVCDPCESHSYAINGIPVSDFYFHNYLTDPKGDGVTQYSFLGSLTSPRQMLDGGYLSFVDRSGQWSQLTWFAGAAPVVDPMSMASGVRFGSLREAVDRLTNAKTKGIKGMVRHVLRAS